jgi:hypothetical protein
MNLSQKLGELHDASLQLVKRRDGQHSQLRIVAHSRNTSGTSSIANTLALQVRETERRLADRANVSNATRQPRGVNVYNAMQMLTFCAATSHPADVGCRMHSCVAAGQVAHVLSYYNPAMPYRDTC